MSTFVEAGAQNRAVGAGEGVVMACESGKLHPDAGALGNKRCS